MSRVLFGYLARTSTKLKSKIEALTILEMKEKKNQPKLKALPTPNASSKNDQERLELLLIRD